MLVLHFTKRLNVLRESPLTFQYFVLISFCLTVCVGVIILIVISIVNPFTCDCLIPLCFLVCGSLYSLSCSLRCPMLLQPLLRWSLTSDLCPLSLRQQTDLWE